MRDWVLRVLGSASPGFAGGPLAAFVPRDTASPLADALRRAPAPDAPLASTRASICRRRGRDERRVAQECEAFLAGRYHELALGDNWQTLPGWAWINPLAHAELSESERLAHLSPSRHDPLGFLSYLAEEVLLRADGNDRTLTRIQHDVLVPLEHALLRQETSSDLLKVARAIRDQLEDPVHQAARPVLGAPGPS